MSCAKMAELIEMRFGMLSHVGPGNIGHRCHCRKEYFWVSGRLKSIVKRRILGIR